MERVKAFFLSLESKWPFPAGMAVGYFGHPFIKFVISALAKLF